MDYDVNKQAITVADTIYKGTHEVPIDSDFVLPDYCPDIGRILRCHVYPSVVSREISGDRLTAEGIAKILLIYSDLEKNTVRSYNAEIQFSQSFDLKIAPEQAVSVFEIKSEYTNCRAISPRRIDIHGAFTLGAKIYGKKIAEVTTDVLADDIQQQKKTTDASELVTLAQQQFTVNEVFDLGSEKPIVESIVRTQANFNGLEVSSASGRVNIKGFITFKVLYISDLETGELESVDYDIPISQTIDTSGVTELSECAVIPEIISENEKIDSGSENESNLINTEIKIMFTLLIFEDKEIESVSDVYSTNFEIDPIKTTVALSKFSGTSADVFTHKYVIDIDNKISKILDVWSDDVRVSYNQNDGSGISAKIEISILALDSDFSPIYLEREIEFKKETPVNLGKLLSSTNENSDFSNKIFLKPEISLINSRLTSENQINISFEINIISNVFNDIKISNVSEITADESRIRSKDDSALTVYYASKGEKIWDIARRYGTTIDKIKDENEIDYNTLSENKILLIPAN
ncbi:MAG: DUF3794 domain-containing protein [Oscillospiraceae bacterium]|jgi:LysM repeat protein|nr:DUF3794 domain-containing protein [Oscillospiraceae bacterium]